MCVYFCLVQVLYRFRSDRKGHTATNLGINGEGETRWQPAVPGSPVMEKWRDVQSAGT